MSASFAATPAELGLVNQIFTQADKQKLGILQGDVAVKVFNGANLPGSVLGEIWSIADEENNGWLSKTGVAKALRLIAHAQKGAKVSSALLAKPAPLPTIEGYPTIPQQNTGTYPIPKSPPPGFPPLSPQDKIKFQNIFNRSGPSNGLLSGEKARDIFLKSKLSNDHLLQIWNLADTRDRGVLDVADFIVAMYFIQGLMTQQISFVPTTLPPGLYEQAGGLSSNLPAPVTRHMSGNSGSLSPVTSAFSRPVQPQYTGQKPGPTTDDVVFSTQSRLPNLPARPPVGSFGPPSVAKGNAYDIWDVTSSEKAQADAIFDGELDTQKLGYIEGDTAVNFMVRSQLPGEELAQIWDLADINSDGRLSRDEFAIAFHLIKKRLASQPLPAQLPPSLIPPSLRNPASVFQTSPPPQQPPPNDLLDLDDTPPPSAVSPQPTGTMSVLQPQSTGATAVPPIPMRNNASASDPFASSPFSASFAPVSNSDLMGDHEDHEERPHTTSPPLQDRSAELGNVRNQLQSTTRSLKTSKAERAKMESMVTNQATELSSLQTQLSSAKAAYDTETTVLSQLKERFTTQSTEIQKVREELIRSESDLSAIRVEKAEIEQAFLRDKEEARDLHKRMIEAGQLADQLKAEVEKAKKEAKQQKGRLAIARKQLSTKEAEKAKVAKELEDANAEVHSAIQEAEEVETQLAQLDVIEQPKPVRGLSEDSVTVAAAQPLPASPDPITTNKSNNPFERLAMSSSPSPRSQSPFLPFSNAAINSPPVATVEDQNDDAKPEPQFSFDQFFGVEIPAPAAEESLKPVPQANGDSTPKDADVEYDHAPASPTTATSTEHFVTPPTTATNEMPSESSDNLTSVAMAKFPSVDDATTNLTTVEDDILGTEKKNGKQDSVDLNMKLQELEVEESDSDDSESDDDDSPLAEVAQKVKEKGTAPVAENGSAGALPTITTAPAPAQNKSRTSFDNIFGESESLTTPAAAALAFGSPVDAPKSSFSPFETSAIARPSEPTKPSDAAGASAFDETLAGFSPPSSAGPAPFTFDGFDDSFDFGAAGGTPLASISTSAAFTGPASAIPAPTSSTSVPATNISTSAPPVQTSFDNIFGATNVATSDSKQHTTPVRATNGSVAQTETAKPTTFDSAFATFDASPNLNLESSFMPATPADNRTAGPQPIQSPRPFPTSGPVSPKATEASSPRPSSVYRSSSPPPRSGSPASPTPRKSTSSKDSHEKLKEPPTRHSKLSIRFPFGRRKNKHQEPLPPSGSSLAPPMEETNRMRTPAGDDDVEAVKQITAMGFSRTQAVEALEKYGYDVTRAINSLLQ